MYRVASALSPCDQSRLKPLLQGRGVARMQSGAGFALRGGVVVLGFSRGVAAEAPPTRLGQVDVMGALGGRGVQGLLRR